jgi:hypothetical protein
MFEVTTRISLTEMAILEYSKRKKTHTQRRLLALQKTRVVVGRVVSFARFGIFKLSQKCIGIIII